MIPSRSQTQCHRRVKETCSAIWHGSDASYEQLNAQKLIVAAGNGDSSDIFAKKVILLGEKEKLRVNDSKEANGWRGRT